MKVEKSSLLVLAIVVLGIIALLVYWVPSFFVDEFYYVNIVYSEKGMSITPEPVELQNASVSKWTDVSATFKNGSNSLCQVEVRSPSLTRNFALEKNAEFGLLLPKRETITISFCGVKKEIRVD